MDKIDDKLKQLISSKDIQNLINKAYNTTENVLPKKDNLFEALKLCPLSKTKVVIFGQDPYYTKGVADGLAFSTTSYKTPLSLQNIFKQIKTEYPNCQFKSNNLSTWAKQGVLLLNSCLTVIENKPLSHSELGWDKLIISIINLINENLENIVFVLWGNNAKKLINLIDQTKHFVLFSAHPSPLSANKGFFGNNHFKKINQFLIKVNKEPIDWNT
ncbi:MAG: uracil-DNA glycosylase [Mycoplasmataceae bacterium]|nr:uracil-DNA glycosylase [Mycoplasmataceae bacterium]